MVGVGRAAVDVGADGIASRLFGLDVDVVTILASALVIIGVDEERPVALVRLAMVHRRCWHVLASRLAPLA